MQSHRAHMLDFLQGHMLDCPLMPYLQAAAQTQGWIACKAVRDPQANDAHCEKTKQAVGVSPTSSWLRCDRTN